MFGSERLLESLGRGLEIACGTGLVLGQSVFSLSVPP